VEGSSQTELKHPKNVYTQYEPRIFSEEEVEVIWQSDAMKCFLTKMDDVLVIFLVSFLLKIRKQKSENLF
jgi:hypothetical protein